VLRQCYDLPFDELSQEVFLGQIAPIRDLPAHQPLPRVHETLSGLPRCIVCLPRYFFLDPSHQSSPFESRSLSQIKSIANLKGKLTVIFMQFQ
jgi:hypothetical protein